MRFIKELADLGFLKLTALYAIGIAILCVVKV